VFAPQFCLPRRNFWWTVATTVTQVVILLLLGAAVVPNESQAGEVEQKGNIGDWSLYCLKGVQDVTFSDCSIATGASVASDPSMWVRVGVAFVGRPYEVAMTIRTPRLNFFSRGISITTQAAQAQATQLGRVFVDKCSEFFCESMSVPILCAKSPKRLLAPLANSSNARAAYFREATEILCVCLYRASVKMVV
jgi:hypothetical protein